MREKYFKTNSFKDEFELVLRFLFHVIMLHTCLGFRGPL